MSYPFCVCQDGRLHLLLLTRTIFEESTAYLVVYIFSRAENESGDLLTKIYDINFQDKAEPPVEGRLPDATKGKLKTFSSPFRSTFCSFIRKMYINFSSISYSSLLQELTT